MNKTTTMLQPDFHVIPLHVYPSNLYLSVNQTDEMFREELTAKKVSKQDIDDFLDRPDNEPGVTGILENGNVLIRLKHYDETMSDFYTRGTIVHESFHATVCVMDFIVASLDHSSEESYAYLLEYMFKEICKKVGL